MTTNTYTAKQDARRERLERSASRAAQAAEAAYRRATAATAGIEFGQPILVGHHSEGKHRAALRRSDTAMRRSVELTRQAAALATAAERVGTGGISSDDPEAVAKLADKRTALEIERDHMKAANAYYAKHKTLQGWDGPEALARHGRSTLQVQAFYDKPFPPYALTNIGARIRAAAKRVVVIEINAAEAATSETIGTAIIDAEPGEENRVTVRWPNRLSRDEYKAVRTMGFVWSPTRNGFTRKYSTAAIWAAQHLAAQIQAAAVTEQREA